MMDRKFHRIIKPIVGGIVFGLFIEIFLFTIYKSLVESLLISLGIGLLFGLFIIIANEYGNIMHVRAIKRKYGRVDKELLKSHQTKELELPVPYEKAFELCMNAVKSLKRCKIQSSNLYAGKIVAIKPTKVPLDWIYNRDLITIELWKIDDNRTRIKITSKIYPDPPTEYYADYGSNLENIEKITEFLFKNVKAQDKTQ